jgi:hypothetical protein
MKRDDDTLHNDQGEVDSFSLIELLSDSPLSFVILNSS